MAEYIEKLSMGGYAFYVWCSFLCVFTTLLLLNGLAYKRLKKALAQQKQPVFKSLENDELLPSKREK